MDNKESRRYTCELCGEKYDHTNTLKIPSTGMFGYLIYANSKVNCVCICKNCVSALQEVIDTRFKNRKEQ